MYSTFIMFVHLYKQYYKQFFAKYDFGKKNHKYVTNKHRCLWRSKELSPVDYCFHDISREFPVLSSSFDMGLLGARF